MSAPEPSKLFSLWQQARIKMEQAMGYSLQNDLKRDQKLAEQQQQLTEQRDTIRRLREDVDRLIVHTKLPLE